MLLFYQAADCTTHGDYVIIGMRREYDDTFRIRFRTFGTISIVCIWFTARPSGDGVLQIVEDLDIHIICRTKQSQQFSSNHFHCNPCLLVSRSACLSVDITRRWRYESVCRSIRRKSLATDGEYVSGYRQQKGR